jgi:hypothetical protein
MKHVACGLPVDWLHVMGEDVVADLRAWLRGWRTRLFQASDDHRVAQRSRPPRVEWVLLESVGSAPLAGMYTDLLRQAGIPVRLEQWDPGSGAFGGLPVGLRLLVPMEMLAAAREILQIGDSEPDVGERGVSHEG